MFRMGPGELVVILLIVVAVFGSTKLPQIGEYLERLLNGEPLVERPDAWTSEDWLLVIAVVALGIAAIVLAHPALAD
jgi:hypothetical protein